MYFEKKKKSRIKTHKNGLIENRQQPYLWVLGSFLCYRFSPFLGYSTIKPPRCCTSTSALTKMYRYNLHYSIYGYYVPGPTRLGKLWKPLLSTDTRGTRETREIVTSRTSPRTLLLHMPLTDLLRQIYRLADSRSGTLESPSGRFFDPRVEGV